MCEHARIHVIYGHFGSGKTEFSINYAQYLHRRCPNVAVIDLDIINTYFRLRDQQSFLEKQGISLFSTSLQKNSTLDVPALDPKIILPLKDPSCEVIIDLGGDPKGSLVLRRFLPFLEEAEGLFVFNSNRPETRTPERAHLYLNDIQSMSGIRATAIVHTTHMLKQTTAALFKEGMKTAEEFSTLSKLPIRYHVCLDSVQKQLQEDPTLSEEEEKKLFPIHLHFRDSWMF